ncbi:MAG: arginine--tRNA ligase [Bacteroidota bacterium]
MKTYLRERLHAAFLRLQFPPDTSPGFEKPRNPAHGHITATAAMALGKKLGKNPREVASRILEAADLDAALVAKAEVAGPGFLNFTFTDRFFALQLPRILEQGADFGRSALGAGKTAQVEFVSANPTGPLTVGHGWGAVYGDTVANLLEWVGYDVTREYYYNNAGRQMRILGDSVRRRYLEALGEEGEFPGDYYQGEYIREIALHLKEKHGEALRSEPPDGPFLKAAEEEIFADIRKTLDTLGIRFRSFYNEKTLYEEGKIGEVTEELRTRGLVYEQEGAVWLRTSALGGDKDKVIVKSTGEPTYRLPDIAYHVEKFRRGYDLMVDVFGADHVATYPDVLAALTALGHDAGRVKVLIHQFVTIVRGGEVVKMSTRKANFYTLDELIQETDPDVVRFFFLMRGIGSHMNFDLALAKARSDENPVYYLQYAHARIAGIIRHAAEQGAGSPSAENPACDLLVSPEETALIQLLLEFPAVVESCALSYEPHRLAEYLHGLAGQFHRFYHGCRVVTEDPALTRARLALCRATARVFRNGFAVLGVSAPEKM